MTTDTKGASSIIDFHLFARRLLIAIDHGTLEELELTDPVRITTVIRLILKLRACFHAHIQNEIGSDRAASSNCSNSNRASGIYRRPACRGPAWWPRPA